MSGQTSESSPTLPELSKTKSGLKSFKISPFQIPQQILESKPAFTSLDIDSLSDVESIDSTDLDLPGRAPSTASTVTVLSPQLPSGLSLASPLLPTMQSSGFRRTCIFRATVVEAAVRDTTAAPAPAPVPV